MDNFGIYIEDYFINNKGYWLTDDQLLGNFAVKDGVYYFIIFINLVQNLFSK